MGDKNRMLAAFIPPFNAILFIVYGVKCYRIKIIQDEDDNGTNPKSKSKGKILNGVTFGRQLIMIDSIRLNKRLVPHFAIYSKFEELSVYSILLLLWVFVFNIFLALSSSWYVFLLFFSFLIQNKYKKFEFEFEQRNWLHNFPSNKFTIFIFFYCC